MNNRCFLSLSNFIGRGGGGGGQTFIMNGLLKSMTLGGCLEAWLFWKTFVEITLMVFILYIQKKQKTNKQNDPYIYIYILIYLEQGYQALDINVCPIPVKTDVGQVDLVLRLSDRTSEKIRFPNVPVRRTNIFPLV